MKIYTRTGDKGETGLLGGGRVGKDNTRINAYGTVDECNALLGIIRTFDIGGQLDDMLSQIQNQLFVVGSDLATPEGKQTKIDRVNDDNVKVLEKWIDLIEDSLPPLKQFILPGGCEAGSYLHLARTVCRRAERWAVALSRDEKVNSSVIVYLNRLSDFLFVAARAANLRVGKSDEPWIGQGPGKSKQ
jgi:cob(I)alamin adenosyltransferase